MREGHFTWEDWAGAPEYAPLTDAGQAVLAWAVDVVRDLFGETWLQDNAAASGHVPLLSHERWPLRNPRTIARLLELAARAALVRQQDAASVLLEQACKIHPNPESVAKSFSHLCLTLEAAAFAITDGWSVSYEQTLPSGRKPDLWLHRNGLDAVVEITVLSFDREFRAAQAWSDRLVRAFFALERRHQVELVRRAEEVLDDDATTQWLTDIEDGCQRTAADGRHRAVRRGGNTAEIFPQGERPGTHTIEGPPISGDLWTRVAARLAEKVKQTRGGPPTWLRIDDIGTMFHLTDWSASPLPERLAHGPVAMRRPLPGYRQRLTFVLPTQHPHVLLPAGTGLEPGLWYDREPRWLDQALHTLGQPPLSALLTT